MLFTLQINIYFNVFGLLLTISYAYNDFICFRVFHEIAWN